MEAAVAAGRAAARAAGRAVVKAAAGMAVRGVRGECAADQELPPVAAEAGPLLVVRVEAEEARMGAEGA